MSQSILHLTGVTVQKDFNGGPQVNFKANDNPAYGNLSFKVSNKKSYKKDQKAEYDNYTILWNNVKADDKIIELLNQPRVRVNIFGELTLETFNNNKFMRVVCYGRNSVSLASFGDNGDTNSNVKSGSSSNKDTSFDFDSDNGL